MKDDRAYLQHIRDSLERIRAYTAGGRAVFFKDAKTQDAVMRNLEVIGEAVKHLSDGCRQLTPEIPWRRIAGMRDVLIHGYFGVKMETVWDVVEKELPRLEEAVDQLLSESAP